MAAIVGLVGIGIFALFVGRGLAEKVAGGVVTDVVAITLKVVNKE